MASFGLSDVQGDEQDMASELRVFVLDQCIVNPPPTQGLEALALAGTLVPKLIELAMGGAAHLLKSAGADKTVQASGSTFANFYVADEEQVLRVNDRIGCVLAVYGSFDDVGGDKTDPKDYAVQRLRARGIIKEGASVEIIFEAAIRPSDDGSAFHLDTRYFGVRGMIGDSDKGERDFAVTLTVTTASATLAGDTIAIGTIDFGTRERGADLIPRDRPVDEYPQFRSNLMPWGQITAASKAAYDADVAANQAAEKQYMPATFTVTISQTQKGHPFLAKLGELLDGKKQEAAAALSKMILPEERAKAEAERSEAAERLYDAELDAELAVREAQKSYDDEGEDGAKPALRVKLEQAKRKRARAIALRKAAGLPDREDVPPQ
jgi:hypothetical protein